MFKKKYECPQFLCLAFALTMSCSEPVTTVDVPYCVDQVAQGAVPEEARCPGFLIAELKNAQEICSQAGGRLIPGESAGLWSIDVDQDGRDEFLFELGGVVGCENAWSIFGCGSLGCPKALYQQQAGSWVVIGVLHADEPGTIEVLAPTEPGGYGDLRVGCAYEDPCSEIAFHRFMGHSYDLVRLEVRGFTVVFEGSVYGLNGLTRAIDVRATPASDGEVLDHYDADTEVVVHGEALGLPWYYVSPCNACRNGFIEMSAVVPLPR